MGSDATEQKVIKCWSANERSHCAISVGTSIIFAVKTNQAIAWWFVTSYDTGKTEALNWHQPNFRGPDDVHLILLSVVDWETFISDPTPYMAEIVL